MSLIRPSSHGVHSVAPNVLYVPGPQSPLHAIDVSPLVAPNVPGGHGWHEYSVSRRAGPPSPGIGPGGTPSDLHDPAGHTSGPGGDDAVAVAVADVVAVAVDVAVAVLPPDRQLERSPPPPNVPSGHDVHENDPTELYWPMPQFKHPDSLS
jgi:hypothetical protein